MFRELEFYVGVFFQGCVYFRRFYVQFRFLGFVSFFYFRQELLGFLGLLQLSFFSRSFCSQAVYGVFQLSYSGGYVTGSEVFSLYQFVFGVYYRLGQSFVVVYFVFQILWSQRKIVLGMLLGIVWGFQSCVCSFMGFQRFVFKDFFVFVINKEFKAFLKFIGGRVFSWVIGLFFWLMESFLGGFYLVFFLQMSQGVQVLVGVSGGC